MAKNRMHRTGHPLSTVMTSGHRLPRGWAIIGLALAGWILFLLAGYGLWLLVT